MFFCPLIWWCFLFPFFFLLALVPFIVIKVLIGKFFLAGCVVLIYLAMCVFIYIFKASQRTLFFSNRKKKLQAVLDEYLTEFLIKKRCRIKVGKFGAYLKFVFTHEPKIDLFGRQ